MKASGHQVLISFNAVINSPLVSYIHRTAHTFTFDRDVADLFKQTVIRTNLSIQITPYDRIVTFGKHFLDYIELLKGSLYLLCICINEAFLSP